MTFKPHEIAYLNGADLGRLATVQREGSPQASPVGFVYNADLGTIDIFGYRMSQSSCEGLSRVYPIRPALCASCSA